MGLGASRADHKKDDGYVPPSDRARARQAPAPSVLLTDPDVAAFDPTADKHDYLLVFATERARSSETLRLSRLERHERGSPRRRCTMISRLSESMRNWACDGTQL